MRFWDTSAIVPLLVDEPTSASAGEWLREDDAVVVWTLTYVELVSALERRAREGALSQTMALSAQDLAVEILDSAHEITAVSAAKGIAARLLRTHPLRAADALQLAAALLWVEGNPAGSVIHTFDERLGLAALREGFRVVPSPTAD